MTTPDFSPCITDADPRRTLLFLDKVFLKPRKANLRGVELFNLNLLKDLVREEFRPTVPVHFSWREIFNREFGGSPSEFCATTWKNNLAGGLQAAWRLRRRRYEKIILANVANDLVPALRLLLLFNPRLEIILFAHRLPARRFLAVLPRKTTRILAVNSIIAGRFKKAGFADAEVFFGHISAARFHPPASRREQNAGGGKVHFCVVGFLENAWKGADTAVAAWRALPEHISAGCVLHLAGYASPPHFPEKNIKVYHWLAADDMPEWLRGMDAMIVPSRDERVMRETFSLAMVEGMLTGLPLVVSTLPVLTEKLSSGGGYVFNSAAELAQSIARLAADAELRARLGQEARRTALARYVWNTGDFIGRYLA
ncbi:MAG: glycosyltransferase family 4 protein [Kiritimatiellae bacterium]|jgi:glycosyltransferase involved in cell wall biosynthesis|nr:glycosyltransferase family 4 protein [Kiritimatiellia bacterium]